MAHGGKLRYSAFGVSLHRWRIMLKLNALGRLTLTDDRGRDFAPLGSKARGAMTLLATAPEYTRTRAWLQKQLWSDRAPEQAAGSLRAALSEIRRALGPHRHILVASRHAITLDPAELSVVCETPGGLAQTGSVQAFEDVEVHDRAFERTIRELRRDVLERWSRQRRAAHRHKHIVLIRSDARGTPAADVGARLLQNRILSALRQIDDLEILSSDTSEDASGAGPQSGPPQAMLVIRLLSVALKDDVFLSCEIRNGRRLWSDNVNVPGAIGAMYESAELDRLALRTVEQATDAFVDADTIAGADACAFTLAREARGLFFRLDKSSLLNADRLFSRAFEIEPRGRHLVWRSFLRNAAFFQHRSMSFLDEAVPITELALEALRHSPDDAIVQTISSQIDYVHQGNLRTPLVMAQRGVERDPTDPLGWALLSNALSTNGKVEEGYSTALRALELTKHSPFQFYFEHFACMAAAALGQYEQALLHARTALLFRPDFVSTRRYEVALNLYGDDVPQLGQAVRALQRQEPDFTPATLLNPGYPVNTLRRLPLMDAIVSRAAVRGRELPVS
jgi:tetratricopeptide (TPR) repeat protein